MKKIVLKYTTKGIGEDVLASGWLSGRTGSKKNHHQMGLIGVLGLQEPVDVVAS